MALITAESRNELTALFVGMFQGAPGAANLSSMVIAYEGGSTLAQIAAQLATKAEFQSVYPAYLTGSEFADLVIANLLPASTPPGAIAWSKDWVLGKLNAGESRASVIAKAVVALNQTTNPNYDDAKALQANKVEVSNHFSMTLDNGTSTTSLLELQAVLSGVTAVATTVTTAIAAADENHAATSAFTLTTGVDSGFAFTGGVGNNIFNAPALENSTPATTLSTGDSINGGGGINTLNLTVTADHNNDQTGTVANMQIVNITGSNFMNGGPSGAALVTSTKAAYDAAVEASVNADDAELQAESALDAATNDAASALRVIE
jgi:hypothetical protein